MPGGSTALRSRSRPASSRRARLHYAAPEGDADMLYATGFLAPDPLLFLQLGRLRLIAASDLELGRARRSARVHRVLSWSAYVREIERQGRRATVARVIRRVLADHGVTRVDVPGRFPLALARDLTRGGVRLSTATGPFWPQRETKRADEVRAITGALRAAEAGIAAGICALRMCRVGGDGFLRQAGRRFTAEDLRAAVNTAVLARGAVPAHTICACGDQAVDPHEGGHGPLRAHAPIVIDVFPRAEATGYFADITRTVVRGRASERVREIYAVVSEALDVALAAVRPGRSGAAVHAQVHEHFKRRGFTTGERRGRMQGFIHGTGHGVGLEIHEAPAISSCQPSQRLRRGHVIALEPGLYYLDLGGVRIEDLAVVTKTGHQMLTRLPRLLEV
jgi:Xaa-Pro aminopeptidase